jgi:hypothetical protein
VGAYAFDVVPACNNPEGTRAALAGYVPDIDVREVRAKNNSFLVHYT